VNAARNIASMTQSKRMGGRKAGCWLATFFSLIFFGCFSATWADLMLSSATLSGGSSVIVNKKDGTTVRGTLNQCTPDLLYVLPAARPNHPPATQPVELSWKQIRTVSNGLTARIAIDIWMTQHAGELCPTCHGERTIRCPVCRGTLHDPKFATTCPTCKGELLVDCKTPGEIKGQIPCPNSCLKLGVGSWAKKPDGLMWRTWHFPHGTQFFSEHHIGDVMFTDPKAMPPISDQGKCPVCGGTTKVDDPACFGTGQIPCPACLARSTAPPCPNHCENGRIVCPDCGGTGLKKS